MLTSCRRGNAVLWYSVRSEADLSKDARTDHEAQPVKAGVKYVVVCVYIYINL